MYDKASIALIPSGYRDGELYSVLPANGDGDFNFGSGSTATRVNKDGLIETVGDDIPRLDYPLTNGVVGDCPHLLLEPQRRNLFTDSDLSGVSATTTGDGTETTTILSNGLSGKKIETTSSGRVFYSLTVTVVSGTQYTVSCYVDEYTGGSISNFIDITSGGGNEDFSSDLITNGRMQGTFTATSTSATIRIGIGTTSTINAANSAKIGGIQLEDSGSGIDATYATSLIQTTGSIVTRSADFCNLSGIGAEFNDSEGVLFAEISALANDGTTREIAISDGGASNRIEIRYISSANDIQAVIRGASSTIILTYNVTDATEFTKVAVKYKSEDYALWVNGVEREVSTTLGTPTGLNELAFDDGNSNFNMYGKCKQLIVFNEALSDSELQTLTS